MELGVVALAVIVGSAGIGIILFTVFVRIVLAPLLITQLRSSKSMQRVQPLVNELKQKHGKDRKALSEATMALYKEHKVNPMMGCLPTLLQFPILIGLFYAFLHLGNSIPSGPHAFPHVCNSITVHSANQWLQSCYSIKGAMGGTHRIYDLFHAQFLWLSNGLGQRDPLFILPVLAGATQWVQSRMMLQKSSDPQQAMMNSMMNFMPLMIVFFATRYPSGLSLYWVTSTVIAIAIQYRITGWGLVPRPAQVLSAFSAFTQSNHGSGSARSRNIQPKKNLIKAGNPTKESAEVVTAAESSENSVSLNGQDGAKERSPKVNAAAQRKKANRAKGGRGGRRG